MVRHIDNSTAFASFCYMLPMIISLHTLQNAMQARENVWKAHDQKGLQHLPLITYTESVELSGQTGTIWVAGLGYTNQNSESTHP